MTLVMTIGLTSFLLFRINSIYSNREHDYRKRDLTYTQDEMENMDVTLGKFNNSYNFIFGLQGLPPDYDLLNNPYVQIQGYEMTFGLGS